MEQEFEKVLVFIDENIYDKFTNKQLASIAGYSEYHFCHQFQETFGISPILYITSRKLQFAAADLSDGGKIIDIAFKYGFETHAGFTKAFKKKYHFPPSLCSTYLQVNKPTTMTSTQLKKQLKGGIILQPHIMDINPITIVGYPQRYQRKNVKSTADAPTFWDTINLGFGPILTKLYATFPKSKHCEISMCYDFDEKSNEFTYILGRAVDLEEELKRIEPDMTKIVIAGGFYAIFSTPICDSEEIVAIVKNCWNEILLHWLPTSEFDYDDTRYPFEYEDLRSHRKIFKDRVQMDLYLPIKPKQ